MKAPPEAGLVPDDAELVASSVREPERFALLYDRTGTGHPFAETRRALFPGAFEEMPVLEIQPLGEGLVVMRHRLDDLDRLDPDRLWPRKQDEPDRDGDDRESDRDDKNPLVLHAAIRAWRR